MSQTHKLNPPSTKKSGGGPIKVILIFFFLILIGAGLAAGFILFETEKPVVALTAEITYLGGHTEIPFQVRDSKSGIRSVVVEIEQKGARKELYRKNYERQTWMYGAGPEKHEDRALFTASEAKLKDGEASLIVTARDFSLNGMLLGNETSIAFPVVIDTKPPRVSIMHKQRYIRPGGSGLVVYDLSEPSVKHGVMVNDRFFPGFPMDQREGRYVAYIALSWNTEKIELSKVLAVDEAGNEGNSVFSMIFKPTAYHSDRITISDGFLSSKIPEFEGNSTEEIKGDNLVEKFIYVNSEIRRSNAQRIMEICSKSGERQLWQDRFLRMSGQSMAGFAEERTYYYNDQAIDRQVHLGMDIASTASVAIKAANRGKVVFADYLGIYGNTVILDHGQGVFSLYSHLSRIESAVEDVVDQGAVIAYSGATGMAGGDHLHFSMLISGHFVNPIEWLDQNWINVNINAILGAL